MLSISVSSIEWALDGEGLCFWQSKTDLSFEVLDPRDLLEERPVISE
jgi:hypothetical protein